MSTSGTLAAASQGHSVGFNLGVIALLVALGGIGAAYVITGAERAGRPATAGAPVTRTIAGATLTIPAAWMSGTNDSGGNGFARQVDLALNLPLGPGGAMRSIDVTLTQRSRVRPSAALLDGVYLHQFLPGELSGPAGLVGKPMAAAEGYEDETVWYDPLSPAPFVAKCQSPIVAGEPGRCLRTVYLSSGIAAIYGFGDDVLESWKSFDAVLAGPLKRIGAL